MGTIADKLTYLNSTKAAIKAAIADKGVSVADTDTFRSYADKIASIETGGSGLTINGIIEQYKVAAGANVSAGDFVSFVENPGFGNKVVYENTYCTAITACSVTEEKVLVAYTNNTSAVHSVVLTIKNNQIEVGEELSVTYSPEFLCSTKLSENKVLLAMGVMSGSNSLKCVVLTINDTTITAGEMTTVFFSRVGSMSVTALSETSAIVIYANPSTSSKGACVAKVLTITGQTITVGSEVTFIDNSKVYNVCSTKLSSTKVLIAYRNSSNAGCVQILTISGTNISAGTAKTYATDSKYFSVSALSDTKAIIVNAGSSGCAAALILSISGTTITTSTPVAFDTTLTQVWYISVDALSTTKAVIAYYDYGTTSKGKVCIANISGTSITISEPAVLDRIRNGQIILKLNDSKAILIYLDNSGYASAIGVTANTTVPTLGGGEIYIKRATDRNSYVGVANTNGNENETVEVYCVAQT